MNKGRYRKDKDKASPANLIWLTEALCALMHVLGPSHHKFSVAYLTGYGGVNKGPGRRGLLCILLFKKQVRQELVTNFATHLDPKERTTVSAALFDHAAVQAALRADVQSQLSEPAKLFFEFGCKAVFSDTMDNSQQYALKTGETVAAWITRHKRLFQAPPGLPVPDGETQLKDDELGPLTLLALPWLQGDMKDSLTSDQEATIQEHVELAVAKSENVRVLNGSEGESTSGTQSPLGPK